MKLIEVITDAQNLKPVTSIAEQHDSEVNWVGSADEQGRQLIRILVSDENRQSVLDALQGLLGETSKILVLSLEAVLPRQEPKTSAAEGGETVTTTREELYNNIVKNARLDSTYLLLVFLSTVVVAIGLLEDNAAVGDRGHGHCSDFGTQYGPGTWSGLGDMPLMWKAIKATLAGLAMALLFSILIGIFWPLNVSSQELMARTDVGLDSVVLALASGAAAVISLTTGLASVLVGVMVAVALLPPTATLGIMLGSGQTKLAVGAALLLAVNIVCVNLAAKIVFWVRGVKPRSWLEKQKANQSMVTYMVIWVLSLTFLLVVIFIRKGLLKGF